MDIYSNIDRNRFNLNAIQEFSPAKNLPEPMSVVWCDLVMHAAELVVSMVNTSQQPSANYIYTFNLLAGGNYPFSNDAFRTVCTEIGLVYWNELMTSGSNGHNKQLLKDVTRKLLELYSIGIITTDRGLQDRTPSNQRQTVENAVATYGNYVKQAYGNMNGNMNSGGWGNPSQQQSGWGNSSWSNDNNNSWAGDSNGGFSDAGWGNNQNSQNHNDGWGNSGTPSSTGGGWADASSGNIDDAGWGSGFSDGTDSDPDKYKTLTEGFVKVSDESNNPTDGLSKQELQDAIDLGLIDDPSKEVNETPTDKTKENTESSFSNQVETDHWGDMLDGGDGVVLDATNWDTVVDDLEPHWVGDSETTESDLKDDIVKESSGIPLQVLISEHEVVTYPKSIELPENFLVEEHNLYYEMINNSLPTTDLITINSDSGPIIAIRETAAPLSMHVRKTTGTIGAHVGRNLTPNKVACLLIDSFFVGHEIMLDLTTHDIYHVKPEELETLGDLCTGVNGVIGDREPDDLKLSDVLELGLVSNPSDFMADIESYLEHRIDTDGVGSILDKTYAFRGQFLETVVKTKIEELGLGINGIKSLAIEVAKLDETNPRIGRAIENVVVRRFNRLISSMYPTTDFTVTSVADLDILHDMLGTDTEDVEDLTKSERITISKMISSVCDKALRVTLEQVKSNSGVMYNTVTVSREFVILYGGNLKDFKFISEQKGGVQTYRVAIDALPAKLKEFLSKEVSSLVSIYLTEDRIMNMVPVDNEWLLIFLL